MQIEWLGHSCFLLTGERGARLITDPYDAKHYRGELDYAPVEVTADLVTVSHRHADHSFVEGVAGDPMVVRTPGARMAAGFEIKGVAALHDDQAGALRGEDVIFNIGAGGINVCHLGDLGQGLSAELVKEIGRVDVLLVPVGGHYTIGAAGATRVWQQLNPPITIPMHYRNSKCRLDLETEDGFLAGKPDVERPGTSEISVSQENLPASPKIVVLEPSH